jgi:hypothetical protein
MKLTLAAYMARPEGDRRRVGTRHAVISRHPATMARVIYPVDIVDRLLPGDCDHDRVHVVRAGILSRSGYLSRCMDCRIGGPVVPGGLNGIHTARQARAALYTAHPRANYREAADVTGRVLGWAERIGDEWLAFVRDASGSDCIGRYDNPDDGVRAVFEKWRVSA